MDSSSSFNTDQECNSFGDSTCINESIKIIQSILDPKDSENIKLLKHLKKQPYSIKSWYQLVQILISIILNSSKNDNLSNKNQILVSQLTSHIRSLICMLEAISKNQQLASLFLVGQTGVHSFSSISKSILKEQASRTQLFLQKFNLDQPTFVSKLSDYSQFFSIYNINPKNDYKKISTLPEKLQELSSIMRNIEESDDVSFLKNSCLEILSLFESQLLLNSLLITDITKNHHTGKKLSKCQEELSQTKEKLQNISDFQTNSHTYSNQSDIIDELQLQRDNLSQQIENLKYEVNLQRVQNESIDKLKRQLNSIKQENSRLSSQVTHLQNKLSSSSNYMKESNIARELEIMINENANLKSMNNTLEQQLKNKQAIIDQRKQTMNSQASQLDNYEDEIQQMSNEKRNQMEELEKLRELYKSAVAQLDESHLSQKKLFQDLKKLRSQYQEANIENISLREILEKTHENLQQQIQDKTVLLKRIRNSPENQDYEQKYIQVKNKLKKALLLIQKLEKEIQLFRQKRNILSTSQESFDSDIVPQRETSCKHCHSNYNPIPFSNLDLGPELDQLDNEIRKLEYQVKSSKAIVGYDSSEFL